jgi:ferritin-like metal-binding protein YciE
MDNLQDLLLHEVKDLYNVEKTLIRALEKMSKKATNEDLKQAFLEHRDQTETHVERLEQVFAELDRKPSSQKCKGIAGIVEEAEEIMKEIEDTEVLDAALITAAQRAEHYEMAAYGGARTYAQMLGLDAAAELLQTTLDEEGDADKKLTEIALARVNEEAMRE